MTAFFIDLLRFDKIVRDINASKNILAVGLNRLLEGIPER